MKTKTELKIRMAELAEQGLEQKKIAEILNAEGFRTTTGAEWSQPSVSWVLRGKARRKRRKARRERARAPAPAAAAEGSRSAPSKDAMAFIQLAIEATWMKPAQKAAIIKEALNW